MCPVLCIDSGLSSSAGFPNTKARAIGMPLAMPLLGIGGASFNDVGDYYAIGLGYCSLPTRKYCCEIGLVITNKAGGECGVTAASWYGRASVSVPSACTQGPRRRRQPS